MYSNQAAIRLYMQLLRQINKFPVIEIRSKLKYNLREMYDIHKRELNPENLNKLLEDGENHLKLLQLLNNADKDVVMSIFERKQ